MGRKKPLHVDYSCIANTKPRPMASVAIMASSPFLERPRSFCGMVIWKLTCKYSKVLDSHIFSYYLEVSTTGHIKKVEMWNDSVCVTSLPDYLFYIICSRLNRARVLKWNKPSLNLQKNTSSICIVTNTYAESSDENFQNVQSEIDCVIRQAVLIQCNPLNFPV